jgi:hypothetical protein
MKQLLGKAFRFHGLSPVELKKQNTDWLRTKSLVSMKRKGRFKIPMLDTPSLETFNNGSLSISYSFWLFPESLKKIIMTAYKHAAIMHTKR